MELLTRAADRFIGLAVLPWRKRRRRSRSVALISTCAGKSVIDAQPQIGGLMEDAALRITVLASGAVIITTM
jgi:hypothetical protein